MKANELMIGDWVGRVFDDKRIIEDYRQVDWIRTGEIGMRYQKVWSIGCIESIPLTAEILEKNGFVFNSCGRRYWYEGFGLALDYGARSKELYLRLFRINRHVHIHYVHELQHALRLCGLNELADNFKI